jgi:hypothetical protein
MSYTVVNPGAKPRPGVVSAASLLLYLVGIIQLGSVVIGLLQIGPIRKVVDEQFAGKPEGNVAGTAAIVGIVIGVALAVFIAVGAIVLGVLVGKGKNPARIVTWVLAGIGTLCTGCGLASNAISGSLTSSMQQANPDQAELSKQIQDAIPSWMTTVSTVTNVLVLICLLLVIILLALPASNDFFRKEQEVWVPPTYPPATGGYGYPPAPPSDPTPPYPPAPPGPPQA